MAVAGAVAAVAAAVAVEIRKSYAKMSFEPRVVVVFVVVDSRRGWLCRGKFLQDREFRLS